MSQTLETCLCYTLCVGVKSIPLLLYLVQKVNALGHVQVRGALSTGVTQRTENWRDLFFWTKLSISSYTKRKRCRVKFCGDFVTVTHYCYFGALYLLLTREIDFWRILQLFRVENFCNYFGRLSPKLKKHLVYTPGHYQRSLVNFVTV